MRLRVLALCAALLSPSLLAACGDLPQPFRGRPGKEAMLLSRPPPARLAVPVPAGGLLSDKAAALWAKDVATAMLDQQVPAVAQAARPGDWRLALTATLQGGQVVPHYAVITPQGELRGTNDGAPVSAASWSAGDPAMLEAAAAQVAPDIATTLTGIQAADMKSDPNSLMNRPARLFFTGVTGAHGDGDQSLARQLRAALPDDTDVLQNTRNGADFIIGGVVAITPAGGGQEHVDITWRVVNADGTEAGKVTQLHDIPAHSLDNYWGDVAMVVAQEAAPGIRQVITNNSGRRHVPLPKPKPDVKVKPAPRA